MNCDCGLPCAKTDASAFTTGPAQTLHFHAPAGPQHITKILYRIPSACPRALSMPLLGSQDERLPWQAKLCPGCASTALKFRGNERLSCVASSRLPATLPPFAADSDRIYELPPPWTASWAAWHAQGASPRPGPRARLEPHSPRLGDSPEPWRCSPGTAAHSRDTATTQCRWWSAWSTAWARHAQAGTTASDSPPRSTQQRWHCSRWAHASA